MAVSRRGVDSKLLQFCPNCHSKNIVKNGHHYGGKLQFLCTTCHRHFTEEEAKGYPPTKIPFPIIAYLLYFRRKVPEFSNMRRYRRFVNYWLQHLRVSDQEVSRQTIHHWINQFNHLLDKVITFDEARGYCHHHLKQLDNVRPPLKTIPYRSALKILEKKFGRKTIVQLIKKDETFFKELVDVISKNGVFLWEFFEEDYLGSSGSQHPLPVG